VKEITDKGWGVIIGGDFNVAQTPMDKWFLGTIQHKTVTGLENMIQSLTLHDVW
jgi:exonuclease III